MKKVNRYVIDREYAKRQHSLHLGRLVQRPRCIISHKSSWLNYWDYLVILLALVNCFTVPLEIAAEPEFSKTLFYTLANIVADSIFFLDILIGFNKSLDENNEEITDRKRIAKDYLKGSFTIDFLSVIPLDLLGQLLFKGLSSKQLKLFSLLKLVRLLRLSRIIRALKVQRDLKAQMKMVVIIFKFLIFLHCSACLQLWVIQYEALWEHPAYMRTLQWEGKFYEDSLTHQYMVCFFYALVINMGKNVQPLTPL